MIIMNLIMKVYFLLHKHKCHTYYKYLCVKYLCFILYKMNSISLHYPEPDLDFSHATIHLLQQQILLVQQIVRGQQMTDKLLTKLIMSNGDSKPQSTIRQKCSEHFILPAKSIAEVCDIEEKLQLSASRQLIINRLQQCGGRSQNDTTTK
ncbi:uncharacterized protein LOC107884867 [Acyrthosiphon pisum]|uniref:Uncharacterized protein n=1 Tax=Acyrthosiphon pisum TaxID=7029 RepID=A0A8R2NK34_ACYPI|nr:uncharacterized protein LOC107884867 [Acyrthosiphon pisum]